MGRVCGIGAFFGTSRYTAVTASGTPRIQLRKQGAADTPLGPLRAVCDMRQDAQVATVTTIF